MTTDKNRVPGGWVAAYLQENTLKVAWSIMLFVGGVLVLQFFVHNQFLPEVDITNATALLASVALLGLLISTYLMFYLLVPGMVFRELVKTRLCGQKKEVGISLLAAPATTGLGLWLASLKENYYFWYAGTSGVVLLLGYGYLWWQNKRSTQRTECVSSESVPTRQHLFTGVSYWISVTCVTWGVWALLGVVNMLVFIKLYGDGSLLEGGAVLCGWMTVVGAANSGWGFNARELNWKIVIGAGGVALVMLLVMTRNYSAVAVSAVHLVGMGEVKSVSIEATKQGCAVIQGALGRKTLCVGAKGRESFTVGPLMLRSRIGGQYLLELCGKRVVLNRADVLGWSSPMETNGQAAGAAAAAAKSTAETICGDRTGKQ